MNTNELQNQIENILILEETRQDKKPATDAILALFKKREEALIEEIEVMGVLSASHLLVEGDDWRDFKQELFNERKSE
jgi:hypothetical protein